jgi:hypothetical protein
MSKKAFTSRTQIPLQRIKLKAPKRSQITQPTTRSRLGRSTTSPAEIPNPMREQDRSQRVHGKIRFIGGLNSDGPAMKAAVDSIENRKCQFYLLVDCRPQMRGLEIIRTNNPAFLQTLFQIRLQSRPRRAARKDHPSPIRERQTISP